MTPAHPNRLVVAFGTLLALVAFVFADVAGSPAIDPFQAPAPVALGSGQAPGGAHCSQL
ncbi:hypothetical protein [Oricola cellulosilytica]|uniref:hypothetical protein n=1 Tax=Oricola cellulosilytica TaxID=1429082 RepID=UPI0018EE9E89|nr:hypothetical protein [Oricola cellulosilytica]